MAESPLHPEGIPDDHPYKSWDGGFIQLREFGFERETLVMMAELEREESGRMVTELNKAVRLIRNYYGEDFEPSHVAGVLLQTAERNYHKSYFELLLEGAEIDEHEPFEGIGFKIIKSYHPDNRFLLAPFKAGVAEDGTIIDAPGPFSSHRNLLVDQYGDLHRLEVRETPETS